MPNFFDMNLKRLCLCSVVLALPWASVTTGQETVELTPVGAIAAGNAAGTIPPWTGGLPAQAIGDNGDIADPFGDDQALFTVNAADTGAYADALSEGQRAMLERYPESYQMPVYPSRRSASLRAS